MLSYMYYLKIYEGGVLMKKLKRYIIPIIVFLLLLQSAIIADIEGIENVYAKTALQDAGKIAPPLFYVQGNIKTDIDCSEEAANQVNVGFTISFDTFSTTTDENGYFYGSIYNGDSTIKGDMIIEKPGFLKRTIKDVELQAYSTAYFNDIYIIPGDMNGDSIINFADCVYLAKKFNSTIGDKIYSADSDINKDGAINLSDFTYIAKYFNITSSVYPPYIHIDITPTPTQTVSPTQVATPTPTPIVSATPTPDLSGLEIERKFLLDPSKIPYDLNKLDKYEIEQAYINFSPEIRIRKVDNWMFFLTVKAYVNDMAMTREEREFWITEQEYNTLKKKIEGNIIYKTRYQGLDENGVMFAIDIFKGNLAGLAYFEMEFPNEEEANKYIPPDWVGKDVTNDKRYKNGSLAQFGIPE